MAQNRNGQMLPAVSLSVLGPSLFLVYINDMPDVINALIKLFADDAKVYNRV